MKSTKGRRQFLGGLLATGLAPRTTWADVGSPAFLSAAARMDGRFVLCGIGLNLNIQFEIPLPARGHAAAAHPVRPEAVAFARRPGTFAVVIDCMTGRSKAVLKAPKGRHFYGHGVFSLDGSLLFTTENDFEAGKGKIGVWDVTQGYRRIDEWSSGGIGPHDIKRLPETDTLVIANGGIDTHPESGRAKLNIPTMRPNLTYLSHGRIIEKAELPSALHKNSIRHLAVADDGQIAFGMQWQGNGSVETLVGVHRIVSPMRLLRVPVDELRKMEGYIGSIACSHDGNTIVVTSPRGGILQFYNVASGQLMHTLHQEDVCGVATLGQSFMFTSGTGEIGQTRVFERLSQNTTDVQWDNHLIPIATV